MWPSQRHEGRPTPRKPFQWSPDVSSSPYRAQGRHSWSPGPVGNGNGGPLHTEELSTPGRKGYPDDRHDDPMLSYLDALTTASQLRESHAACHLRSTAIFQEDREQREPRAGEWTRPTRSGLMNPKHSGRWKGGDPPTATAVTASLRTSRFVTLEKDDANRPTALVALYWEADAQMCGAVRLHRGSCSVLPSSWVQHLCTDLESPRSQFWVSATVTRIPAGVSLRLCTTVGGRSVARLREVGDHAVVLVPATGGEVWVRDEDMTVDFGSNTPVDIHLTVWRGNGPAEAAESGRASSGRQGVSWAPAQALHRPSPRHGPDEYLTAYRRARWESGGGRMAGVEGDSSPARRRGGQSVVHAPSPNLAAMGQRHEQLPRELATASGVGVGVGSPMQYESRIAYLEQSTARIETMLQALLQEVERAPRVPQRETRPESGAWPHGGGEQRAAAVDRSRQRRGDVAPTVVADRRVGIAPHDPPSPARPSTTAAVEVASTPPPPGRNAATSSSSSSRRALRSPRSSYLDAQYEAVTQRLHHLQSELGNLGLLRAAKSARADSEEEAKDSSEATSGE